MNLVIAWPGFLGATLLAAEQTWQLALRMIRGEQVVRAR
jgi:hypothetical protein